MPATMFEVEEDLTFGDITARRRPLGIKPTTIASEIANANLVVDFCWLVDCGLSFETIAKRLGYTVDRLEVALRRAGFMYRTPERLAVERRIDALIARGPGFRFSTSDIDIPHALTSTVSLVIQAANRQGRIRMAEPPKLSSARSAAIWEVI
ncbi:hypothetical protein D5S18_28290 [Nocardia panacis]|uniref:Uncharacterized protein n=1 Tax=Nocardia panacis TaxID=2340916 RepID=A0A3A4KBY3_9NOCA|nr:hypothetical protein [Nocardia panacis]RJO69802.1 hypothetical protein D5S18_28290 [Nocardia panacis]